MSGKTLIPLTGLLALSACAVVPPSGPSVFVLPPPGKDYAQFQREDFACRGQAQARVGDVTGPQVAANNAAVGSAALGTAVGAVAGAALGSLSGNVGAGAAIGAGVGLAAGSATGANQVAATSGGLQRAYDVTYLQCMAASGNNPPPAVAVPAAPYPYYGYPYYYGPRVSFGVGYYGPRTYGWRRW